MATLAIMAIKTKMLLWKKKEQNYCYNLQRAWQHVSAKIVKMNIHYITFSTDVTSQKMTTEIEHEWILNFFEAKTTDL